MRKTSKIILVTIVATCILLGLGYAAIQNITLNITGTASATADAGNFKVRFTDNITVSESAYVTATRSGDQAATIAVSGLTSAGQKVTATYEIVNESSDLSADLNVATTNNNTEYFKISSKLASSSLIAGESTTVLVTVELTKTPIEEDVNATIGVNLTAMPVQPGEEGTSIGTNDYSETPSTVNEYGFYFDEIYVSEVEDGISYGIIAHEDGSAEMRVNEILQYYEPAGGLIYSDNRIDYGNVVVTVENNGEQLIWGEDVYTLDKTYMERVNALRKNEYGFYFGQAYSLFSIDKMETFIFNEDGSLELYVDGEIFDALPKDSTIYSKNKILYTLEETTTVNGETVTEIINVEFNILGDGRIIEIDGEYFGLDLTFLGKYCLPEGHFYGTYIDIWEETEQLIWLRQVPLTYTFWDIYLTDEYAYSYANEKWAVALPIKISDFMPSGYVPVTRNEESYGDIPETVLGYPVYSMIGLYENCINLKIAPAIPNTMEYIGDAFKGCTSLKTAPVIPSSVTDMRDTFNGCTSLEGDIFINVEELDSYSGCFEGVDMSKITLKGTASKEIKNKLGNTGLNYTPIP